jgi:hypothetical protein
LHNLLLWDCILGYIITLSQLNTSLLFPKLRNRLVKIKEVSMFAFIITGNEKTNVLQIELALEEYSDDIKLLDSIPEKVVLVEGSRSVVQKFASENDLIATPEKEFRLHGKGFTRRGYPGASAPVPLSEEADDKIFLTQFDN